MSRYTWKALFPHIGTGGKELYLNVLTESEILSAVKEEP